MPRLPAARTGIVTSTQPRRLSRRRPSALARRYASGSGFTAVEASVAIPWGSLRNAAASAAVAVAAAASAAAATGATTASVVVAPTADVAAARPTAVAATT